MAEGFIKLYRQLQEHKLWLAEPFTKGQAWVDLILMVNHKKGQWFNGATHEEIDRGCIITSEVKLAERWKWSRKKVRNFLEMLSKAQMLEQNKNSKRTYLKIIQYCVWQDTGTAKEHQKNNGGTTEEQRGNTNKNVKNDKNENNIDEANKNSLLSKQADCEKRRLDFGMSLKAYAGKYERKMLSDFFNYWSELNKSKTKMRFESQKTWELPLRLVTWENNKANWTKGSGQQAQTATPKYKTASEILAERQQRQNT